MLAALVTWGLWHRARLSKSNVAGLEPFLQAAVQQGEFEEVDRILRRNLDNFPEIPAGAAALLFDPRVVHRLVNSHSFLHLELLARRPFLEHLENRFQAIEVVVREILEAGTSPLQSAVVKKWGGIENLSYTEHDRELIDKTIQNPDWYHDSNFHYPLIITAVNKIQTGTFEESYNRPDESYSAAQGVSKRATCPIYLALKTEVLAIEAALRAGSEKDFYISDLFQILQMILDHAKKDPSGPYLSSGLKAPSTPFVFLIETIMNDLEDLTQTAVQESVKRHQGPPENAKPSHIGATLVRMWSFSIAEIIDEADKLDDSLRDRIVGSYFRFMLALGWQVSELLYDAHQVANLNHWRDLLLRELKARLQGSGSQKHPGVVKTALAQLDHGKMFIIEGWPWLKSGVLPSQFLPEE